LPQRLNPEEMTLLETSNARKPAMSFLMSDTWPCHTKFQVLYSMLNPVIPANRQAVQKHTSDIHHRQQYISQRCVFMFVTAAESSWNAAWQAAERAPRARSTGEHTAAEA
jgi:hypothetical protein